MKYKLYKKSSGYTVQLYETRDLNVLANRIAHAAVLFYASDRLVPEFQIEMVEEAKHDDRS